jgi:hypothetical protein
MDLEPGRIRVHEHAETGKPLAADLRGIRRKIRPLLAYLPGVARPRRRLGWNGPAQRNLQVAQSRFGHKLSAIGSPHQTACSSGIFPLRVHRVTHLGGPSSASRRPSDSQVIPPAYPRPFRSRVSPSLLAAPRFSAQPGSQPARTRGLLLKGMPQVSQLAQSQ